jgi:hypothetical protein
LAFAVDAGWARHQESLQWNRQRTQLAEELVRNVSQVESSLSASGSLETHLEGLLVVLGRLPDETIVAVSDSLIASVFFNPEWSYLETSVADGLQASGQLMSLDGSEIGERMSRWSVLRAGAVLRQEELRVHFRERLLPELSSLIEIAPFVAYRSPAPGQLDGQTLPWEAASGSTAIRNSQGLRNVLSERLLLLRATSRQAGMARGALENLHTVLQD